jgi:RHH-type transcriptional regulator, proline utilization regulon repressor / proline dehydrogenase / delta 1-pyrroline-5-carboxylate dehydrogenase
LIRPPRGDLETALKTLEPGESWALRPAQTGANPNLWSPGVKYGVKPGGYTHQTEFFGPVLGVMRFEKLDEAIYLVNETGYGLTSGLHSLDEREHQIWKERVRAGNLYINRGTTGAIVLRQPFGGMGKSSVGPGMKAGGPNYVAQFMCFEESDTVPPGKEEILNEHLGETAEALEAFTRPNTPDDEPGWDLFRVAEALGLTSALESDAPRMLCAISSYDRWWRDEFGCEHDHLRLLGQDNVRRYLPYREIRVRVTPADSIFQIVARACAARATGARVIVSAPPDLPGIGLLDQLTRTWAAAIEFVEENDAQLADAIRAMPAEAQERIRFAAPDRVPDLIREAAADRGVYLADEPVLAEGRIELLWYLREQSISFDYHRYGNLGARAGEDRAVPA